MVSSHKYLRLRRTWIDCSSCESRREGVLLYRPGRKWLRFVPILLAKLAWLPWLGVRTFREILPGFELEKAIGKGVKYATIYTGNGSAASKYTLLVRQADGLEVVVKLACTAEGRAAIQNECRALNRLQDSGMEQLKRCVPVPLSEGSQGNWYWSCQTVLPRGESPNELTREHFEFLAVLKKVNVTHGDFTPWNCSIVNGQLFVWDWEGAGDYKEGFDAAWFKGQVKKLLLIDA